MKRNEVLNKLVTTMAKIKDAKLSPREAAEVVLDHVELLGMLPPQSNPSADNYDYWYPDNEEK